MAGAQLDAQRQMPLPDNVAGTQAALAAAPRPAEEAFAEWAANRPPRRPGGLAAPSDRPNEPLTAGLPMGPGPGPEVIGRAQMSRVASTLGEIAQATGDPVMQRMADEAARRRV